MFADLSIRTDAKLKFGVSSSGFGRQLSRERDVHAVARLVRDDARARQRAEQREVAEQVERLAGSSSKRSGPLSQRSRSHTSALSAEPPRKRS